MEQPKSCETREVTYNRRYCSGRLMHNSVMVIIGVKCPLAYLQVQATSLVSQLFSYSLLFCSLIPKLNLKLLIFAYSFCSVVPNKKSFD